MKRILSFKFSFLPAGFVKGEKNSESATELIFMKYSSLQLPLGSIYLPGGNELRSGSVTGFAFDEGTGDFATLIESEEDLPYEDQSYVKELMSKNGWTELEEDTSDSLDV